MTEQEYINLTELERVRNAIIILRKITPTISVVIAETEHAALMRVLSAWENALSKEIKTTEG
jgi:hypothetical protein